MVRSLPVILAVALVALFLGIALVHLGALTSAAIPLSIDTMTTLPTALIKLGCSGGCR